MAPISTFRIRNVTFLAQNKRLNVFFVTTFLFFAFGATLFAYVVAHATKPDLPAAPIAILTVFAVLLFGLCIYLDALDRWYSNCRRRTNGFDGGKQRKWPTADAGTKTPDLEGGSSLFASGSYLSPNLEKSLPPTPPRSFLKNASAHDPTPMGSAESLRRYYRGLGVVAPPELAHSRSSASSSFAHSNDELIDNDRQHPLLSHSSRHTAGDSSLYSISENSAIDLAHMSYKRWARTSHPQELTNGIYLPPTPPTTGALSTLLSEGSREVSTVSLASEPGGSVTNVRIAEPQQAMLRPMAQSATSLQLPRKVFPSGNLRATCASSVYSPTVSLLSDQFDLEIPVSWPTSQVSDLMTRSPLFGAMAQPAKQPMQLRPNTDGTRLVVDKHGFYSME
ncbi:hypothetical protein LTS18_009711 [Coniosporium uncinatum]|uniref:Uncharacterized protein n=1 Tax=Coniosporium uncinatum TaxID=93489 RepID=A0ACC3DWP5_9PEZI|nr:hypothetical protein LTS18_009711 [Coniosporium uncinatum]